MRVTVTGASGTIGLATVNMLVRAGHQVRAFVRTAARLRGRCREERIEVVEGDILDRAAVAAALSGADAVIHCVDFSLREFALSWDALRHALEALRPGGQFVYPGVVWVFGPTEDGRVGPEHPKTSPARLGAVRADLEKAVTAEGGTVVRLPDVYGPGVLRGPLHDMFERALTGKTIRVLGDLDRAVEYLYIEDAARALIAPLGRPQGRGRDYHAPGFAPTTPRQFAALIFTSAGGAPRLRSLSPRWLRLLALTRRDRRAASELGYMYENPILLDGTRTRRELGWMPEVDYADGVRRTVRWLRARTASQGAAYTAASA